MAARRIPRIRRAAALAAALVTAFAGATSAHAGSAPRPPVPLTTARSVNPVVDQVIGHTSQYLLLTRSSHYTYSFVRVGFDGTGSTVVGPTSPTEVSGDLVRITAYDPSRDTWLDLRTGASRDMPAGELLAPHGGVRAVQQSDGWHVMYDRFADQGDPTVDLGALPGSAHHDTAPALVATTDGMIAFSNDTAGGRYLDFSSSYATGSFTQLDTRALGDYFDCSAVIARAVACSSEVSRSIARIPTNGMAGTTFPLTGNLTPNGIVLTTGYTYWTTRNTYPTSYDLHAAAANATTDVLVRKGITTPTLTAVGANIYFGDGVTLGTAGVYRLALPGTPQRVLTSPRAPLSATLPALGPGRAAWVDDSTSGGYHVHTATVSGAASGGPVVVGAVRDLGNETKQFATSIAVSGTRTAWNTTQTSTRPAALRLNNGQTTRTLPGDVPDTVISMSGTRILYCRGGGIALHDLVSGKTTDLTTMYHLATPDNCPAPGAAANVALYGNFLAFARADASIWRVYIGSGQPVQLSPPRFDSTAIVSIAGDWVSWYKISGEDQTAPDEGGYRNYRTMAAPVARDLFPAAVSAAGYLSYEGGLLVVRSWASGNVLASLPSSLGGYFVSAGIGHGQYASALSSSGTPGIAAFAAHLNDRPRSLANPFVATSARLYHRWHLDLVSSAVLSYCSVRITRGTTVVRTLGCDQGAKQVGEIATGWTPGTVGPGNYRWTIVAGNADGTMLTRAGTGGLTSGSLKIMR